MAKPTSQPVVRRAASQRSTRNAAAVLKAITQESIANGLDGIVASSVAKRAGLTTGAIYSRFENSDEMLIALWENVVAPEFEQFLVNTIAAINSPTPITATSPIVELLEKPSRILGLGAEFLAIAQRNDVVGEVVTPQISLWLSDAGLHQRNNAVKKAGVALGASIAIGSALRSFITGTNAGMPIITESIRSSIGAATPTSAPRKRLDPVSTQSNTGVPLRDALINATAEVMSKTGFTNATISRIARKSQVTSGSIYNFYPDKEALMGDAVRELMRTTQRQTLDAKRTATSTHSENFGLTDAFDFALYPERTVWLRFRRECIIATRHHKKTHRELRTVVAEQQEAMAMSFPDIDRELISLVSTGEQIIGYGFSALVGYTNQLESCDFDAVMVQVAKQNNL
jgi:AcrR family transcriptional regulator